MDRHELFCLLAVQRLFFDCPRVALELFDLVKKPSEIFDEPRKRWHPLFFGKKNLYDGFIRFDDWKSVENDLKLLESLGAEIIGFCDEKYPNLLKEAYDPPPVLIIKGADTDLLNGASVGIVGARKATQHGLCVAAQIAEDLAGFGFVIVSGMAYGIDSAAHRGALAGGGLTIAVFGCGIDIIYPHSNRRLSDEIALNGLLLSEFPVGKRPYKPNFPQRNRVISGLSLATVVVEAGEKSGSLITARFALEQNREVFAVPGAAGHPGVRGTNRLIRDGATLVESGDDVARLLERYLPKRGNSKKTGQLEADKGKDSKILEVFPTRGDCSVDFLVAATGLNASDVLERLTQLVLEGRVEERPGHRFRLKRGGAGS